MSGGKADTAPHPGQDNYLRSCHFLLFFLLLCVFCGDMTSQTHICMLRKYLQRHPYEESKLLHFVRFQEKSLWKSPDLTPPPVNQSEPSASPGNSNQAGERRTNQNSTPTPSPEGDQSDPETPVFRIFLTMIPYISNVTQSSGLLPIAAALVSVGAPARAW